MTPGIVGLEDSVAGIDVAWVYAAAHSSPEVEAKLEVAWSVGREAAERGESRPWDAAAAAAAASRMASDFVMPETSAAARTPGSRHRSAGHILDMEASHKNIERYGQVVTDIVMLEIAIESPVILMYERSTLEEVATPTRWTPQPQWRWQPRRVRDFFWSAT